MIETIAAQMEGAGSSWRAAALRMAQVIGRSGDCDVYNGEKATRVTALGACVVWGEERDGSPES